MPHSSLSPPPFSLPTSSSSSCSYSFPPAVVHSGVSCSRVSRTRKPITLNCVKARSLQHRGSKRGEDLRILRVRSSNEQPYMAASSNVTSEELKEGGEEENSPTLPEQEANSRPRRIALFVEPSPFSWVPSHFLYIHVIGSSLRPFMLSLLARILWHYLNLSFLY